MYCVAFQTCYNSIGKKQYIFVFFHIRQTLYYCLNLVIPSISVYDLCLLSWFWLSTSALIHINKYKLSWSAACLLLFCMYSINLLKLKLLLLWDKHCGSVCVLSHKTQKNLALSKRTRYSKNDVHHVIWNKMKWCFFFPMPIGFFFLGSLIILKVNTICRHSNIQAVF